jgi:hypothetical protein
LLHKITYMDSGEAAANIGKMIGHWGGDGGGKGEEGRRYTRLRQKEREEGFKPEELPGKDLKSFWKWETTSKKIIINNQK